MGLFQRDSENADRDITSKIAVLTDTVDVSGNYVVRVMLGDGAKGLDGTGGDFELSISIDGRVAQPNPQVIAVEAATTEGNIESLPFISLAGEEVIAYVLSPNAADTDVDVTASLQDLTRALPAVAPGAENGVPTLSASLAVKANLAEILGTALTETGGYIAAGFKKLFNVATPVLVASDVMRGTDGVDTAAMRGTDGAVTSLSGVATESKQNTAQSDLDKLTGADGATLATLQPNYTPAVVGDIPTPTEIDTELTTNHGAGSWATGAAAPTVGDIDTELTANHGAGSWLAGGISGSNTVAITIVDQVAAPTPDASVTIKNAAGTVLLDAKLSDTNGIVDFTADDGTYLLYVRKAGYSYTVPETLVVNGDTTQTVTGALVTPALPDPNLQALLVSVIDYGYEGTDGAVITATPEGENQYLDSTVVSSEILTATTVAGIAYLSIAKLGRFRIRGHYGDSQFLTKSIVVTTADSASITDY